MKTKLLSIYIVVIVLLLVGHTNAQNLDWLKIHGFGGWAFAKTDTNNYIIGNEDGNWRTSQFALNLTANPYRKLSINTQLFLQSGLKQDNINLDYVFGEWAFSDEIRLRIGKIKSPIGLYSEIYDVGTLRPFYLLPVGMYYGPGLFPKSYVGLGATGNFMLNEKFEFQYDLLYGEMDFQTFKLEMPVGFDPFTGPVMGKINFTPIGREVIGGKITILPLIQGLKIGLSYLNMDIWTSRDGGPLTRDDTIQNRVYITSGHFEYLTDFISFRSELYAINEDIKTNGGYIEAALSFLKNWQVGICYDWYENTTESSVERTIVKSMMEHKSLGFSLNYWANPNLVMKVSYYRVNGNGFAQPDWIHASYFAGILEEKTNVFIAGTQFSF